MPLRWAYTCFQVHMPDFTLKSLNSSKINGFIQKKDSENRVSEPQTKVISVEMLGVKTSHNRCNYHVYVHEPMLHPINAYWFPGC